MSDLTQYTSETISDLKAPITDWVQYLAVDHDLSKKSCSLYLFKNVVADAHRLVIVTDRTTNSYLLNGEDSTGEEHLQDYQLIGEGVEVILSNDPEVISRLARVANDIDLEEIEIALVD